MLSLSISSSSQFVLLPHFFLSAFSSLPPPPLPLYPPLSVSLLPGAALYLKGPVQPKLFLQLLGRGVIKV